MFSWKAIGTIEHKRGALLRFERAVSSIRRGAKVWFYPTGTYVVRVEDFG